jgi:hypothetical protein
LRPCSLCGAYGISTDCLHCRGSRSSIFSELSVEDQIDLIKLDQARPGRPNPLAGRQAAFDAGKVPRVGLIGCGKSKLRVRASARELYIGNLFRAALHHAERTCDEVYILSASYGLLHLNSIILPYDKPMIRLSRPEQAAWGHKVVGALLALFPVMCVTFDVYAGEAYVEPLANAVAIEGGSWTINTPLEGLTLGRRLRYFKEERA